MAMYLCSRHGIQHIATLKSDAGCPRCREERQQQAPAFAQPAPDKDLASPHTPTAQREAEEAVIRAAEDYAVNCKMDGPGSYPARMTAENICESVQKLQSLRNAPKPVKPEEVALGSQFRFLKDNGEPGRNIWLMAQKNGHRLAVNTTNWVALHFQPESRIIPIEESDQ